MIGIVAWIATISPMRFSVSSQPRGELRASSSTKPATSAARPSTKNALAFASSP